jgi:hypothetical protein
MVKEYLDETKAYLNEEERLAVAWELLSYAHMLYSRVYVFKNFEAFSKSFRSDPPEEYWEGLHREKLIDQIKICTAFENYNKSVLLSKGFIVHTIDGEKNRGLAGQQKTKPVLISDFLSSNKFVREDQFSELYLEGFRNFNTIAFSKTLNEQYQAVIGLEERFLNYLKSLNEKRNRLHFYKNYAGAFRVETYLENLNYAKTYGTELLISELKKVAELQKKFN